MKLARRYAMQKVAQLLIMQHPLKRLNNTMHLAFCRLNFYFEFTWYWSLLPLFDVQMTIEKEDSKF